MRGILVFVVMAACVRPAIAQESVGGMLPTRWLPREPGMTAQAAQLARNEEYFSVRIHAAHLYYRSPRLRDLRNLVIGSQVTLKMGEGESGKIEAAMVNGALARDRRSLEDWVSVNEHLIAQCPSTPTNVRVKVIIQGITQDRYKNIFDILSRRETQALVGIASKALPALGAVTSIVNEFMGGQSPYVDNDPRNLYDMEKSFTIYPRSDREYSDALREGYWVWTTPLEVPADNLRLSGQGQTRLEYQVDGEWQELKEATYVILEVIRCPAIGEHQGAAWYRKYRQAEEAVRDLCLMPPEQWPAARDTAIELWREGNLLLEADESYVRPEKNLILAACLDRVQNEIKSAHASCPQPGPELSVSDAADVPKNFSELAAAYSQILADSAGTISVVAGDQKLAPTWKSVFLHRADDPNVKSEGVLDEFGNCKFDALLPGRYIVAFQAADATGEPQWSDVIVDAGDDIKIAPPGG